MTPPTPVDYAEEIRSWLLGRLAKGMVTGAIPAQRAAMLDHAPVLFWWIFEGRRFDGLDGPLCRNWATIDRQVRRLLVTYNPDWRQVDAPEGETDWIASYFHTLTSGRPVFVSKASIVGLSLGEREALLGWLEWLRQSWSDYCARLGPAEGAAESVPWAARPERLAKADRWTLRRWAHTAKRSRWPLLRNVVAESLRCALEPQQLDQLPLPQEPATLFEILCMVRILRVFEKRPWHVRWLDREMGRNRVELPGLTYAFQKALDHAVVLGSSEFDHGLRRAMQHHRVRIPSKVDGWLLFDEPRNGFAGVLIEAKSGAQGPHAAVYQLKCYRAALKKFIRQPLLVWGIVEQAPTVPGQETAVAALSDELATPPREDVWVFSTADEIPVVLKATGIVSGDSRNDERVLPAAS